MLGILFCVKFTKCLTDLPRHGILFAVVVSTKHLMKRRYIYEKVLGNVGRF